MDSGHPSAADPSSEHSLRCEDCGALRKEAEPGWVRVAYPAPGRREADGEVFLYYCPVHGAHFDRLHPDVAAAFGA